MVLQLLKTKNQHHFSLLKIKTRVGYHLHISVRAVFCPQMSMLRTLISLAAAATLINAATAISYTVGGPTGGWDTATNVQAWASSQTFLVGDSLSKCIQMAYDCRK